MHSYVLYSVFKHSMIVKEFGCCSLRALSILIISITLVRAFQRFGAYPL